MDINGTMFFVFFRNLRGLLFVIVSITYFQCLIAEILHAYKLPEHTWSGLDDILISKHHHQLNKR